ncbi:MAG: DUF2306 domain-containing protein [Saprospiraceae bacterium]
MQFQGVLKTGIFASLILASSYLMLQIILPYTSGALDIDFLLTKQHIIHLLHYRFAFYFHIFTSLFVLLAGILQFSGFFLRKWPLLHRWIGRSYVFIILCISGPAAMVMSFYANGGWMSRISFIILTALWWWFTWKAYQTARQRAFATHGEFMIRSYALTLSAITLRIYQFLLGTFWLMDPQFQYLLVAWGSWVINLGLAEGLIRWQRRKDPLFFQ